MLLQKLISYETLVENSADLYKVQKTMTTAVLLVPGYLIMSHKSRVFQCIKSQTIMKFIYT